MPHYPQGSNENLIQLSKADMTRWRYRISEWGLSMVVGGTLPYNGYDAVTGQPATYQFSLDLTATTTAGPEQAAFDQPYDAEENQLLAAYAINQQVYQSGSGTLVEPLICTGSVTSSDPELIKLGGPLFAQGFLRLSIFGWPEAYQGGVNANATYDPATQLFAPLITLSGIIAICNMVGNVVNSVAQVYMSVPDVYEADPQYYALVPPKNVTTLIDGNPLQVGCGVSQGLYAVSPQTGPGISVGPDFSAYFAAVPSVYFAYIPADNNNMPLYDAHAGTPLYTPAQIDSAAFP